MKRPVESAALIAYRHLTPGARAKRDALLASDTDPLSSGDFDSRAVGRRRLNPQEFAAVRGLSPGSLWE
jgi:hypothetical protein